MALNRISFISISLLFPTAIYATCLYHITSESGVISSPNFPENYPNNTRCIWILTGRPSYKVVLTFTDFDLEDVRYDYVSVSDGEYRLLGKFGGNKIPGTFESSSNNMMVKFKSDYKGTRRGFKANFYIIPDYYPKCFHNITMQKGHIMNPDSHGMRPNHSECGWLFTAKRGQKIMLRFIYIQRKGCLSIYDGQDSSKPLLGHFGSAEIPNSIESSSNLLYVVYRNEARERYAGFLVKYTMNPFIADIYEEHLKREWIEGERLSG